MKIQEHLKRFINTVIDYMKWYFTSIYALKYRAQFYFLLIGGGVAIIKYNIQDKKLPWDLVIGLSTILTIWLIITFVFGYKKWKKKKEGGLFDE